MQQHTRPTLALAGRPTVAELNTASTRTTALLDSADLKAFQDTPRAFELEMVQRSLSPSGTLSSAQRFYDMVEAQIGLGEAPPEDEDDELPIGAPIENLLIVVFPAGEPAYLKVIPHTLEAMQAIVGGLIERIESPIPHTIAFANEEGLNLDLPLNRHWPMIGHPVVGTFFVTGDQGQECVSMTREQVYDLYLDAPFGIRGVLDGLELDEEGEALFQEVNG